MKEGEKVFLDFHGCAVEFACADAALAAEIRSDFSAFTASPAATQLKLRANISAVSAPDRQQVRLRTRRWSVLSSPSGRRSVWYPGGALCDYDYRSRSGVIQSGDPALLRELSYLLILSRAGEDLDRRGLHRVHAGALGFEGRALLFCGPQGAGKTTLLLQLLKEPAFSLLSDDTPLADSAGMVHPFPARIGLGLESPHLGDFSGLRAFTRRHYPPKRLLDPRSAGLRLSPALPAGPVLLLRRGARPRILPAASGAGAAELAVSLAAGYGVPQLAEYFLRLSPSDIGAKAGILFSRLRAAAALLKRASCHVFELSQDPAANAAELRTFLRSGSAAA